MPRGCEYDAGNRELLRNSWLNHLSIGVAAIAHIQTDSERAERTREITSANEATSGSGSSLANRDRLVNGRSSDSCVDSFAFSPISAMAKIERSRSQIQRRGRPGISPEFPVCRSLTKVTGHQFTRLLVPRNLSQSDEASTLPAEESKMLRVSKIFVPAMRTSAATG